MQNGQVVVNARWDKEVSVWVATSSDVPGLVTEAESVEALIKKLCALIPELLDANGYADADDVSFALFTQRFEVAGRCLA